MASYRGLRPRILWGATYQNELLVGYPFDACVTWPEPREGSEQVMGPSGVEDAWTVATDYFLKGVWRWIPRTRTTNPYATGWNDPNGVRDFLTWARDKNQVRFYPDGRNLLSSSAMNADADANGVVDDFASTVAGGATAAVSLDPVESAQKIVVSANAAGPGIIAYVWQWVIAAPGDVLTASADLKCAGLVGGAQACVQVWFHDMNGSFLQATGSQKTTAANYSRLLSSGTAPANTAKARVVLGLSSTANGDVGTVWARNSRVTRGADSAYVASVAPKLCTLVEPMKGDPPLEADLTRQLPVTLRAADGTAFDGY